MSNNYPPGILRGPSGEWKVRATKVDPRTGKLTARKKTLPASASLKDAVLAHDELIVAIVTGGNLSAKAESLEDYAHSWLERRLPWIGSKLTQQRYAEALDLHIIPQLGDLLVSVIMKSDIERWFVTSSKADRYALRKYPEGRKRPKPAPYSADTINGWWRILKLVLQSAVVERHLKVDPTMTVKPLPTQERSDEKANVLTHEEVALLLEYARIHRPQWYAFLALGFHIGARPGELRPLRFDVDLNLETGVLVLQRSQRRAQLGSTKTRKNRRMQLSDELIEILRWHRAYLKATHPGAASGLVFPGSGKWRPWHEYSPEHTDEKFLSPSALDVPLAEMCAAIGVTREITAKTMRRTFNTIAEETGIGALTIRSISGHKGEEMRNLYTDVKDPAKRSAVAQLSKLFVLGPPPAIPTESPGRARLRQKVRDKSGDKLRGHLEPSKTSRGNEKNG